MKSKFSLFFIFPFLQAVLCHDEDIHTVQYNAENFSIELTRRNNFVMFFAPWCGNCNTFAPTWEQLAEMLNEDDSNVRIAKVDCTTDSEICKEQDITGYPTLKFYKVGDPMGVKFRGIRDLPSLTTFINEQLRIGEEENSYKIPQVVNKLVELTDETFDKFVAEGKHFVKFYAPWCGHCQKLAPVWEELAESFKQEPLVNIAKVDCTQYRSICNNFDVRGYPTLLWIEEGKKIEKYQGQRTHEDLKSYVNRMLGASEEIGSKEDKSETENGWSAGVLTGNTFADGVESGITFVKFFAPWCGHCKRLAPTWEELGKKFIGKSDVNIMKVDCTLDVNKQLCSNQEVEGFPSIFLYKNGKKISEYNGSRSLDDLYEFVLKHTGHDEL